MNITDRATPRPVPPLFVALAWGWVVVPFTYGLISLILKIPALFG